MHKIKLLVVFCLIFSLSSVSLASASRTVIILNDLFVDFAVTSDNPYWINDSQIVHNKGRVNYEDDGRYILTNSKAYYRILDGTYGPRLREAWAGKFGTDFESDMLDYYNTRQLNINITGDLDLKNYWYERKAKVFRD